MNNLEGLIDDQYLRLYDPEHWDRINDEYNSKTFISGYKIIGSIDDEAICLGEDETVYKIPFIPMSVQLAEKLYGDLNELRKATETSLKVVDESYKNYGLELHFIKPIAFGGSPINPKNRTFVPQPEHAKLCVFWNETYFRITRKRKI
jgi:hypothetical protein